MIPDFIDGRFEVFVRSVDVKQQRRRATQQQFRRARMNTSHHFRAAHRNREVRVLEEKGLRSAVMEAVIAAGEMSAAMSKEGAK